MRALPQLFGGARDGKANRAFSLGAAAAVHAVAFGLLLSSGTIERAAARNGLTLIDLPLAQAASPAEMPAVAEKTEKNVVREPAKPTLADQPPMALLPMPSILASAAQTPAPVLMLPSPVVMAMLDAADGAAVGGGCDLTGPVETALRTSADVQAALPDIPRASRSVANAIMIWNMQWIGQDRQLPPLATTAVRDVVAATIAAATPECRMQVQAGPRLLMLPGAPENTVLALGSGSWRWQDILNTTFPGGAVDEAGQPIDVEPVFAPSLYAASQ